MSTHLDPTSGSSGGSAPALSEAEFQSLVDMIGRDMPEVVIDLLDTYLEESAGLVEAIQSGIQQANHDAMLRPSHSLKSSSASVGALRLSRLCSDLEAYLRGSMPGLDVPEQVRQIATEFGRVQVALEAEKVKLME